MSVGKTMATNRRARFDFEILETVEAGLVLTGTEIKAIREGRANISEGFARPQSDEIWLFNAHISPYSSASGENHEPTRPRKLLLHKEQIISLSKQVAEKGLSIVPLRLYLRRHLAKVELGLARGRRRYDKRRAIIDREREREARSAVSR